MKTKYNKNRHLDRGSHRDREQVKTSARVWPNI